MANRSLEIPQTIQRGEAFDQEAHLFWSEIIGRLTGARQNRAGGVLKMPAQADATGWADSTAQADFNALLQGLRDAGVMEVS